MQRIFFTAAISGLMLSSAWAAEKDTPVAAATRKKLQAKISVDYKDVPLKEIMDDIKQKVNDATGTDLSITMDNPGGVSNNSTLSYSAKDKKSAEKPKGKPTNDEPPPDKSLDKPEDDSEKAERDAGRQLKYVKTFIMEEKNDLAIKHCKEIIKKYPKTKAAEEAKKLLEKLEK